MILPPGEWTTVAQSIGLFRWHWVDGWHGPTLLSMAHQGDIILMQKRTEGDRFDLLARPACQAWRRVRRRLADNPLPARVVRR